MKILNSSIFVSVLALGFVGAAEQDIRKIYATPTVYLKAIQVQIQAPEADLGANKPLADNLQTMAYAISQEIMAADSTDWATPSPARKAITEKWGKILQPFTETLVGLALNGDTGQTSAGIYSRSLLDFTLPTQAFADQVRSYLKQPGWGAFAAADLLYEHRLLTDEDKQALRERRPAADPDATRWALGVSSLGMRDGLEIAAKKLESTPIVGMPEEVIRQYESSLEIANLLGSDASVLLPYIESLIENPVIKSSGYLSYFENTHDVLIGKKVREPRLAKNGSGPLNSSLTTEVSKRPEAASAVVLPQPEKKTTTAPALSTPIDELTSPSPWSVIAVLVVAVSCLLWLVLKRRS
jgi:hypothetical protein